MTFDEMLELKGIEELIERYYNSRRFDTALEYIINKFYNSPYEFYYRFLLFNKDMKYLDRPLAARDLYAVLLEFMKGVAGTEELEMINELLRFDFLSSDSSNNLPQGIYRDLEPGLRNYVLNFSKTVLL
jgi:hypothetical protein